MTYVEGSFSNLGFDPLPGDPNIVKALESDARVFGQRMLDQAAFMRKVANRDGWQGDAANMFAQHVGSIPKDFDKIGSAFLKLADAMEKYHERFVLEKTKANELEKRAAAARQALNTAQSAFDVPVITAPDSCPPPKDRGPLNTAEDDFGAIIREGHGFAERFDCSPEVQGLAKQIREFAKNAPDEPRWNIIRRWAGDVFEHTPLAGVHDLINRFPEFFSDLADLLADVSGVLGLLSLPLLLFPPLGPAAALAALAISAGSAALKTSLYVGKARDANGKLYVGGGELISALGDVGLNSVGIGVGAAAGAAADAAQAAGKTFGKEFSMEFAGRYGTELANQFSRKVVVGDARLALQELAALRERVGKIGVAKYLAKSTAEAWADKTGIDLALSIGGVGLTVGAPVVTAKEPHNYFGWQSAWNLPDHFLDVFHDAPNTPDLELRVRPDSGVTQSPEPPPMGPPKPPPQPVMDR